MIDYLTSGRVPANHEDFKEIGYETVLQKLSMSDARDFYTHGFRLAAAYDKEAMPYTNYT